MTISARVRERAVDTRLSLSDLALSKWHGVAIEQLKKLTVGVHFWSFQDKEKNRADDLERDPGAQPVSALEYDGKKIVAEHRVGDATVNGLEIPVGQEVLSASGNVIFTRTD